MERRVFLKKALTAAAAAGGAAMSACARRESGPAVVTHPHVTWRASSSFPRALDTLYGSCEVLAERIAALSDGRFRIRTYPAGEIVPGLQVMDAVQQGTVQVGQTASYYFTGKNPALAFDACVPFGLSSRQQTAWLYEGGGLELMRGLFADFNIISFPAGNTGTQMGGWFQRELHSVSDLQGLKMRIPGLGGQVMHRLGATVQVLAGGDIFPALERGAIDATEWVGPYDDEKLGFYKVAKLYYYPGWWEPGPSLSFYVHRAAWDRLPKTYQMIFETAARDAAVTMQARYDARNPPALARLLQNGVQLRPFPADIMQAAHRAAFEILEEEASKDATYRRIYEAWKRARAEAYDWFGTAELAYASFAFKSRRG
ncbi:MAG: TRAP transporter substrate-binding protein [Candidatus Krumholzibacteriia bacterium]